MSRRKKKNNPYVTAELCEAYRQVLDERINGLKKAIYISTLSITTTLTVVQIILTLLR